MEIAHTLSIPCKNQLWDAVENEKRSLSQRQVFYYLNFPEHPCILKKNQKGVQYGTYGENRRSLQKHGSKSRFLEDISLQLEVVGFLGPNGAGKKLNLEGFSWD